jgi:tetratricopeptide (TPR) repeat protein
MKQSTATKTTSSLPNTVLRPSSRALRASLLLPIVIALLIWLAGLIVFAVAPGRFDAAVSLAIGAGLLLFLIYDLRARPGSQRERSIALLLMLPAVAGIAAGLIRGQALYAITGVSGSLLLLGLQRTLNVPFSFRLARRRLQMGDADGAFELVNKSLAARPDFWQSYQLRALVLLSRLNFRAAERDARKALELRPDAHPVYNTLGQLYLAEEKFAEAKEAYTKALELRPATPLYLYFFGLAAYRLQEYQPAAEALSVAVQAPLPVRTYQLQAYYYLGRSLEKLKRKEEAAEAFQEMANLKDALPTLQEELAVQPDFPHLPRLREDLVELKRLLNTI